MYKISTLVTGFGPFGEINENPSGILASQCGRPHRLLEVSYSFVDNWLTATDAEEFDRLLLIGVKAKGTHLQLETVAWNEYGVKEDVGGNARTPGPIATDAEESLKATLWPTGLLESPPEGFVTSTDAGRYLCNYTLFQALRRFPNKPVGFLHVPTFETMPFEVQLSRVQNLLRLIEV